MPTTPRRLILKRVAWTGGILFWLYVHSLPLSVYLVENYCPQAFPIWRTFYWPLNLYTHSDLPGAEVLQDYLALCYTGIHLFLRP